MRKIFLVLVMILVLIPLVVRADAVPPYIRPSQSLIFLETSDGFGSLGLSNIVDKEINASFSGHGMTFAVQQHSFAPYENFTLYYSVNQSLANFIIVNDSTDGFLTIVPVEIDYVRFSCMKDTLFTFSSGDASSGIAKYFGCALFSHWDITWEKESIMGNSTDGITPTTTEQSGFPVYSWMILVLALIIFFIIIRKDIRQKPLKWSVVTFLLAMLIVFLLFLLPK